MTDLVITWPKKRPLKSYLDELAKAQEHGLDINFRIPRMPKIPLGAWEDRAGRCYVVYDGCVRGYNKIKYIMYREADEVMDPITKEYWPAGYYIVRDPKWYRLNGGPSAPNHVCNNPMCSIGLPEMQGFRGFRYYTG